MITKQDLQKILDFVRRMSVKDSQFQAVSEVDGTEQLALVKGSSNKRISLSDFVDGIARIIDLEKVPVVFDGNETTLKALLGWLKANIGNGDGGGGGSTTADLVGYSNEAFPDYTNVESVLNHLLSTGQSVTSVGLSVVNAGSVDPRLRISINFEDGTSYNNSLSISQITDPLKQFIFDNIGGYYSLKYDRAPICRLYSVEPMDALPETVTNGLWFGNDHKLHYKQGFETFTLGAPARILYYCNEFAYWYDSTSGSFQKIKADWPDLSGYAQVNNKTDRIDYDKIPSQVLMSMGTSLDGDDPVDLGSIRNGFYYSQENRKIYYNNVNGSRVLSYEVVPNPGIVYCNACTGLLYRWAGDAQNPWVLLTPEYSPDVSNKADLVYAGSGSTKMLAPNQWPKTILLNIDEDTFTEALSIEALSPGDVVFDYRDSDNPRLLVLTGGSGRPGLWPDSWESVNLGAPQEGTIYCHKASGLLYRWYSGINTEGDGAFTPVGLGSSDGDETISVPTLLSQLGESNASLHYSITEKTELWRISHLVRDYSGLENRAYSAVQPQEIINNLFINSASRPLSAGMGRALGQMCRIVVNEIRTTDLVTIPDGFNHYVYFLNDEESPKMVCMHVIDRTVAVAKTDEVEPRMFYNLDDGNIYIWDGETLNTLEIEGSGSGGGGTSVEIVSSDEQSTDDNNTLYFFLRSLLQGVGSYNNLLQNETEAGQTYAPGVLYSLVEDGKFVLPQRVRPGGAPAEDPITVEDNVVYYAGVRTPMNMYGTAVVSQKTKVADTSDTALLCMYSTGQFFADETHIRIDYDDPAIKVMWIDDRSPLCMNGETSASLTTLYTEPGSYNDENGNFVPSRYPRILRESGSIETFVNTKQRESLSDVNTLKYVYYRPRRYAIVRDLSYVDPVTEEPYLDTATGACAGSKHTVYFNTVDDGGNVVASVQVKVIFSPVQLFYKDGVDYWTNQNGRCYVSVYKNGSTATTNISSKPIELMSTIPCIKYGIKGGGKHGALHLASSNSTNEAGTAYNDLGTCDIDMSQYHMFYASVLFHDRSEAKGFLTYAQAFPGNEVYHGTTGNNCFSTNDMNSENYFPNNGINVWGVKVLRCSIQNIRNGGVVTMGLQFYSLTAVSHINELGLITYDPTLFKD